MNLADRPRTRAALVIVAGMAVLSAAIPAEVALAQQDRQALDSGSADPVALLNALRRLFGAAEQQKPAPAVVPPSPPPTVAEPVVEPPAPATVQRRRVARQPTGACAGSQLDKSELAEMQALLNEIFRASGGGAGTIDGQCGPRTVAAIRSFQSDQGLDVDGVPTADLLGRVREVGATVANRSMTAPPSAIDGAEEPTLPPARIEPVVGLEPPTPAAGGAPPAAPPSSPGTAAAPLPAVPPASDRGALPGDPALWQAPPREAPRGPPVELPRAPAYASKPLAAYSGGPVPDASFAERSPFFSQERGPPAGRQTR